MDIKKIIQEAYDAVIRQGGPSMDSTGCCYRGEGGRKCIIGHMIPDKYYHGDMEDKRVEAVMESFKVPTLEAFNLRIHVLNELQLAHDRAALGALPGPRRDEEFLALFKERIAKLSLRFNLGLEV